MGVSKKRHPYPGLWCYPASTGYTLTKGSESWRVRGFSDVRVSIRDIIGISGSQQNLWHPCFASAFSWKRSGPLALFSSNLDKRLIRYYHFKDLSINPTQCLIRISTRYRKGMIPRRITPLTNGCSFSDKLPDWTFRFLSINKILVKCELQIMIVVVFPHSHFAFCLFT